MILLEQNVASNLANYLNSLTREALRDWGIDSDSLVRSLQDQLDTGHRHDEVLITAIADALMDSLSRNVMSGSTLQALRNAVLIPSERAKVAALIRNGEMGCANCGRDFINEEMVILSKRATTPNDSSKFLLFCTRCMVPRWISCTKGSCKGKAELPKNMKNILTGTKSVCGEHGEGAVKQDAPTVAPVGVDFPDLDTPAQQDSALQTLNRLRRAAGVPIPAGNIVQSRWGAVTPAEPIQWTPDQQWTVAPSTIVGNMATQEAYMQLLRENQARERRDAEEAEIERRNREYFDDEEG